MAAIPEELTAPRQRTYSEQGIWSWVMTVDHKRIGIMYIVSAIAFFAMGGAEAFIIRLQLMRPDNHLVSSQLYSQLFTMHGTTMIFLAVMPLLIGFMNAIFPLQIGARDVAFPRLNALSFWLFLAGGIFLNTSWFLGGAPNAGWFNYSPISANLYNPGPGIDFYDLGLQLAGIGTLMTGINFLVTIINMRTKGMGFMRMPMFVWTTFVTSILIIFAFPPLTVNFFLLMFDRLFHAGFFNATTGGNPLLWAQLFWVFGHPEVYILILPAFGIISEVMATFSRKPLFGYDSMVFATLAIGFLAFMVWTHHMFALGFGPVVNSIFAVTSMAIAIPTGVKVFNWVATMWGGSLRLTTAMLWAIGFLPTFVIGGISGVMLAVAPADLQFNNSYFVVAHLHYVLIGGTLFGLFAGAYYWFPKITGRLLDERLGRWNFWLVMIGFNVTFFPMHIMALLGMPRRVFTYSPGLGLSFWNLVSTIGVFILTPGILVFAYNFFRSLRHGQIAGPDPWDARTLEWTTSSPAPEYNFAHLPVVRGRDALWVEKQTGNGRMLPAEEPAHGEHAGIHMPTPSYVPALMALGLLIAAYGALYTNVVVALIGVGLAVYCIHRSMFEEDPGRYVVPHEEAAR